MFLGPDVHMHHQQGPVELQLKHEDTEVERGPASVSLLGGAGEAQGSRQSPCLFSASQVGLEG